MKYNFSEFIEVAIKRGFRDEYVLPTSMKTVMIESIIEVLFSVIG